MEKKKKKETEKTKINSNIKRKEQNIFHAHCKNVVFDVDCQSIDMLHRFSEPELDNNLAFTTEKQQQKEE
jgi:hypothetical protein